MKKRLLAISLAAGCTALFTACDETTNTDIMNADAAATVDSLPKCDKSYDGMLATIPSKGEILVCTQGEWEKVAKTIGSSTPGSSDGSTAGCTAKTLSDGDGVQIVCNGKTIATLKNGEKGPEGSAGSPGGKGTDGSDAGNGSNGSRGENFDFGANDCAIHRVVGDLIIYNCGDSTYQEALSEVNVKTWNALNLIPDFTNRNGSSIGQISTRFWASSTPGVSDGGLVRWEGDEAWSSGANVSDLSKTFAIAGTATLTIDGEDKVTTNSLYSVEPMVGADLLFTSLHNVAAWGGVCLTYKSTENMEILLVDDSYEQIARAKVNKSAGITTVNVITTDFAPDSAKYNLEDIARSARHVIIKLVGSQEPGEYTNEFAIYEIGAYGRCNGPTISDVEVWAESVKKGTGTLIDDRTDPAITYNTVTIGNQTWMAENLRLPYDAISDDGDGDPETEKGDPMALCPAEDASAEELAKGCLYTWAAAMDSVGLYNEASVYQDEDGNNVVLKHCGYNKSCALEAPVKGICPDGWHLPSKVEIDTLRKYANFRDDYLKVRFMATAAESGNWLGFSAVRSGALNAGLASYNITEDFRAWTTDQYDDATPRNFAVMYSTETLTTGVNLTANMATAVRCIQDQANE